MLLHLWFPLIWYEKWPCYKKIEFWHFDHISLVHPGGSGTCLRSKITFDMFYIYCTSVCSCYHVAAFAIPLMCSMTMFWKSWILTFWGERGAAGKIFATMLLHLRFPLIWYATWSCSAKVTFEFMTLGSGEGCGQNICYHVTAFMIAFNFIGNMTMFWKRWILNFWPPGSGGGGGGSARIIFATMLHVAAPVIPFNLICNMTMFWKKV